jgi:hypothetical protein
MAAGFQLVVKGRGRRLAWDGGMADITLGFAEIASAVPRD